MFAWPEMKITRHQKKKQRKLQKRRGRLVGGFAETIGDRMRMEDRHVVDVNNRFFGVFDGHGGEHTADYVAKTLQTNIQMCYVINKQWKSAIANAFMETDAQWKKLSSDGSGSTACCCVIREGTLYCANLGDSRAILKRTSGIVVLSYDQTPNAPEERERIEELNGSVWKQGASPYCMLTGFESESKESTRIVNHEIYRVCGFSLARAFGDFNYRPYICSTPVVTEFQLDKSEQFLIIGCDGFWDVISNEAAVQMVMFYLQRGKTPTEIAERLVDKAKAMCKSNHMCDNVTVVLVVWKFD